VCSPLHPDVRYIDDLCFDRQYLPITPKESVDDSLWNDISGSTGYLGESASDIIQRLIPSILGTGRKADLLRDLPFDYTRQFSIFRLRDGERVAGTLFSPSPPSTAGTRNSDFDAVSRC
jgi:hypothetical protein